MMMMTMASVHPMEVAQVGRRTSTTTAVRMPVRLGAAPKLAAACVGLRAESAIAHAGAALSNGAKVVMMRHKCKVPRLSRPADQRKALIRGLATGGSLHQRRQALSFVYDKNLVHALFEEVPGRYGERNGGYTRIFQTLPRRGDNSPISIIELL